MSPSNRRVRLRSVLPKLGARHARAALFFLPNFALAKLVIYLLPLAIAAIASAEIYGGVELAQSIGLMAAALVLGAPMSGLTQVYLVRGERRVADQIALVTFIGCSAAIVLTSAAYLLGFKSLVLMVVASLGVAVLHFVGATVFRMLSFRNATAWADGTAMILSGLLVLFLLIASPDPTLAQLSAGFFVIAAAGAIGSLAWLARAREPGLAKRLGTAMKVGLPITVVGALAIWLGVGGRIIVGLINASALPAYGVAFRVAGLALGVHQLAITAFYARLYAGRTRQADRVLGAFLAVVAGLSLAIAILGGYLPRLVDMAALEGGGLATYAAVLPMAALHTFFWIGYAMLQMRISRYGLAARTILPTVLITVGGVAAIFSAGWLISNDIVLLSWLIALHAAAYFFSAVVILARRGLPHRWVTLVGAAGGAAIALVAALASRG